MSIRFKLSGLAALAMLVSGLVGREVRADEPADDSTRKNIAIAVVESETESNEEVEEGEEAEEAKITLPKLWLGIALKGIEGDLAAFLGSSAGVLVDQVQPDSPAAKAGLLVGDIVVSVDGKELESPQNLLEIMGSATEGTALKLQVQRKSEKLEISVTPEARPEHSMKIARVVGELGEGDEGLGGLRLKVERTPGSEEEVYMFQLGDPSALFVPDKVQLEGNVTIQMTKEDDGKTVEIKISKESDKPAEITVKQGDEVQTLTEDQLDKLPEELRNWVSSALSGKKARWVGLKDLEIHGVPGIKGKRIELRELGDLKELSKLLDSEKLGEGKVELQKMVDELTKNAKEQAHEALKKALEHAGESAAENTAQQAKELAKQYADQLVQSAKQKAEQLKNRAKSAEEAARAEVEEIKKSAQSQDQSEQISELKSLIEQLKKEIVELRSGSK